MNLVKIFVETNHPDDFWMVQDTMDVVRLSFRALSLGDLVRSDDGCSLETETTYSLNDRLRDRLEGVASFQSKEGYRAEVEIDPSQNRAGIKLFYSR